jgi:hypothetical protein
MLLKQHLYFLDLLVSLSFFYDFWFEEQRGIPSAESSRSVRGLGKGVSVASLTLAYAMRVDCDSNLGPSGPQAVRLYRLHQAWCKLLMGYEFP